MMKFSHKYQFVKYISRIFSILPRSKGCRILMYHSLDQKLEDDIDWKYKLEKSLFEAQMNLLKSKKPSFVKQLNTKTLKEDSMIITFDDGFLDTLVVAAPVLIERDLPFTVFVSPGLINSNDPRYLSKNSLKSLHKIDGCTIGAHGYSHRKLTDCNKNELNNELKNSKKWLEDFLSEPVETMSYPHGAINKRVIDAVKESGYVFAATSKPGINSINFDPLMLNRTDIWSIDNLRTFKNKINGNWDWTKRFL